MCIWAVSYHRLYISDEGTIHAISDILAISGYYTAAEHHNSRARAAGIVFRGAKADAAGDKTMMSCMTYLSLTNKLLFFTNSISFVDLYFVPSNIDYHSEFFFLMQVKFKKMIQT